MFISSGVNKIYEAAANADKAKKDKEDKGEKDKAKKSKDDFPLPSPNIIIAIPAFKPKLF